MIVNDISKFSFLLSSLAHYFSNNFVGLMKHLEQNVNSTVTTIDVITQVKHVTTFQYIFLY